jgi:hypothetical protein
MQDSSVKDGLLASIDQEERVTDLVTTAIEVHPSSG